MVTGGPSLSQNLSLAKLLNISQNLTKSHSAKILSQNKRFAATSTAIDLNYNFIRSLLLDNVVENTHLTGAILRNEITCLKDLENFSRI
jgi:hypothetical protein